MSALIDRLWRLFYGMLCHDCGAAVYPWQRRHRNGHAACAHQRLATLQRRARENYGVDWRGCSECDWGAP